MTEVSPRAAALDSIISLCDAQRGAPPPFLSGTGSESVGTIVSQAERQHSGEGSVVTHCCCMCFRSGGYRFRWWPHIDGSSRPMWEHHKALSGHRGEESLLAAKKPARMTNYRPIFVLSPKIPQSFVPPLAKLCRSGRQKAAPRCSPPRP